MALDITSPKSANDAGIVLEILDQIGHHGLETAKANSERRISGASLFYAIFRFHMATAALNLCSFREHRRGANVCFLLKREDDDVREIDRDRRSCCHVAVGVDRLAAGERNISIPI